MVNKPSEEDLEQEASDSFLTQKPDTEDAQDLIKAFADHPELLSKLKESAKKDFRPITWELMFVVDHYFREKEKGI